MYSLPISTYTDYWRMTRLWSTYLGGTVAILAGTSLIGPLARGQISVVPKPPPAAYSGNMGIVAAPRPVVPLESAGASALNGAGERPDFPAASKPVSVSYRLQDVEIPAPVEVRETSQLPPGMKKVQEEGTAGLKRQVIKITQVEGSTEEVVVQEFQVDAPKKRVVIQNSKPISGEKLDLASLNVAGTFMVEATAYTYTGNPTATGVSPREGLIAVDPRVIPLGSRVYIEGYGYAVAADTGGAILGRKVDVFFPSLKECLDWGRRPVRLFLLRSSNSA